MKLKLKSFILSISLACLISSACSNSEDPSIANQEFQFTNIKAVEAAKILKENPNAVVLDIEHPLNLTRLFQCGKHRFQS